MKTVLLSSGLFQKSHIWEIKDTLKNIGQRLASSEFSRPSIFLFQSVLQFLIFSLVSHSFCPVF